MKKEIIEALKNPEVAKAIGDGISNAVIKALKDAGVECTADDVKEMFKAPEGKLSDDELENVAGGFICAFGGGAVIGGYQGGSRF